jgi:tRNA uridine 5-carboxymethylaminomethyl modification enzyme
VQIEGISLISQICALVNFLHVGHYSAHLFRQEADLRLFMEDESLKLDPDMDYNVVEGLSSEVRERLGKVRPGTIVSICLSQRKIKLMDEKGAAKRMEGMTPTSIVCLLRHAKRTFGKSLKADPHPRDAEPAVAAI